MIALFCAYFLTLFTVGIVNLASWLLNPSCLISAQWQFWHLALSRLYALGHGSHLHLKLGVLRLSQWTKNFNPHTNCQTHGEIWIRLLELPQEYWRRNGWIFLQGGGFYERLPDFLFHCNNIGHGISLWCLTTFLVHKKKLFPSS